MPLQSVLDSVAELRNAQHVEPLPGGLTNQNYKVVTPDGSYVIRISHKDSSLLAIDRENELHNTIAAADDDDVGAIRKRCGGHECVRRPLSVGGVYVVEQPGQARALEFGDGGLVTFHRPGPEVELQCAGCALDAPP